MISHADVEEELRQIEWQLGNFLWDKRRGVALARVALPATSNNPAVRQLLKDVESLRRRLAALEVRAAATVRSRILRLQGRCDRLIDELKAR